MKKLLMGSISLLIVALSVSLFQISCSKDAKAETNVGSTTSAPLLNKILYLNNQKIFVANIDGSGEHQVNVTIPPNQSIEQMRFSPDGKYIFIRALKTAAPDGDYLYKLPIDGGDLITVLQKTQVNDFIGLQDIR